MRLTGSISGDFFGVGRDQRSSTTSSLGRSSPVLFMQLRVLMIRELREVVVAILCSGEAKALH